MTQSLIDSAVPKEMPPLDESFRPAFLANRAFQKAVAESGKGVPLVLGLERSEHALSRFETTVFPEGHPSASENLWYAERLLKFLLWSRGAWRVYVGGPESIARHLKQAYAPKGTRAFDFHFMGEDVYRQTFTVVGCEPAAVPAERHQEHSLGRHLRGCRIGFDLGASDLKVSAVVDGQPVFSKEIEWQPRDHTDPRYHRHMILSALHLAAAAPAADRRDRRQLGRRLRRQPAPDRLPLPRHPQGPLRRGPPDVRAHPRRVRRAARRRERRRGHGARGLDVARGRQHPGRRARLERGGRLRHAAGQHHRLAERARLRARSTTRRRRRPTSGRATAAAASSTSRSSASSGSRPRSGSTIPGEITPAKKLKLVQEKLDAGHDGARKIWETMGVYMGYGIAHYAAVLLAEARADPRPLHLRVRRSADPGRRQARAPGSGPRAGRRVNIQLPDEKSRRVGQSIAAASLPVIRGGGRSMKLQLETAEIYVPDGRPTQEALARTTHLAVSAHQDDIEIMASDGVLRCFRQDDRWFTGVVVTNGAGSPRDDLYRDYTDEAMRKVRAHEQKKAAFVGEYAAQLLLDYPSSAVKSAADARPVDRHRRDPRGHAARGRLHPQPGRQARHPRRGGAARDRGRPRAARRRRGPRRSTAARSGATSTG